MRLLSIILLLTFTSSLHSEPCVTPNNETAKCISLYSCSILLEALSLENEDSMNFVWNSTCGGTATNPMVCCGTSSTFQKERSLEKILPNRRICGLQHSDDYLHQTDDTGIDEFPWLAIIKLRYSNGLVSREKYECGGSLISHRYVLTAAECLTRADHKVVGIRLGEYHIRNSTDCINYRETRECSDVPLDYGVDKIIPHPDYDGDVHDVGLIRLNRSVRYSDYIRPICLPLSGIKKAQNGDTLVTSGWAFLRIDKYGNIKTRMEGRLLSRKQCKTEVEQNVICIQPNRDNNSNVCFYGNFGSPVVFFKKLRWHQEGIVTGMSSCNSQNEPIFYLSVTYYLDWIISNMEL